MTHVVPGEDLAARAHRYGRCVRGFRHPYLWGRHHPLVVDVVIAVTVAAFGLVTELVGPVEEGLRGPNGLSVEERAERLERERDAEAQRAVLEERTRIARDLHDVVAHGMSVMVVQAGAARRTLAHDDTDRATEALRNIEATGRGALEEMRRLVGVLRASATDDGDGSDGSADGAGPPRLPQPGIGDLDDLVTHCREAGLDVTLRVEGDRRELPSGLELVVYRIAQEALTNTIRHAGPARAEVRLGYGSDHLELGVTDDGRGAATSPRAEPGHGLAGMRERVALYGGTITVGPQRGGGFRVLARLPLDLAAHAVPGPATAIPVVRNGATP